MRWLLFTVYYKFNWWIKVYEKTVIAACLSFLMKEKKNYKVHKEQSEGEKNNRRKDLWCL